MRRIVEAMLVYTTNPLHTRGRTRMGQLRYVGHHGAGGWVPPGSLRPESSVNRSEPPPAPRIRLSLQLYDVLLG